MTYNERVQALARKMAQNYNNEERASYEYQRDWIHYISAAHIAVADMAEIAEPFYFSKAMNDGHTGEWARRIAKINLKEQGLILDNEDYKTAPAGQQKTK